MNWASVTIEPQSPFAAIYVTARDPKATIDTGRELLIVALARARNTGMKFSPSGDRMLARGEAPIVLEPVKARITLRRPGAPRVILLDHDGRPTAETLEPAGGTLTIDGASRPHAVLPGAVLILTPDSTTRWRVG